MGFGGTLAQKELINIFMRIGKKLLIKRGEDGFGEIEGSNFTLLHARLISMVYLKKEDNR